MKRHAAPPLWRKLLAVAGVTVLLMGMASLMSLAENVVITEETNPELTFYKIISGERYTSNGTYRSEGDKHIITTNANVCWEGKDDIDIAYKNYKFNYGKQGVLTIETKVESWSGARDTASAGLMIRSSLAPDAASIFFGPRPQGIFFLYRFKDGVNFAKGPIIATSPGYPIYLRLVLSNSKVTAYYRYAETENWVSMSGQVPFQYTTDSLVVGVCAHTSDEDDTATAVFDGFKAKVEAPEGSVPDEGGDPQEPEEEDKLPEDLPISGNDILLRETFTDNSMTDGVESVTNPVWVTTVPSPPIETNAEKTNRSLHQFYTDDGQYRAGNPLWTDYSTTADICFPKEYLDEETNTLSFLVRHQASAQYGYNDYAVIFTTKIQGEKKTQYLQIGKRIFATKTTNPHTVLAQKELTFNPDTGEDDRYLRTAVESYVDEASGKTRYRDTGEHIDNPFVLRVDTVDNVITVYINGEKVLSAVDTEIDPSRKLNQYNTTGGIGINTSHCNVYIDNIVVRRLTDPIGGDYDNRISGNFDQPIPDYLKPFVDNKWVY